jgi:hypothetical protein
VRLVTRGDLDGLTCAVLISFNEEVDALKLIHPQDITEGRFEVGPDDILANLPYDPRCGLWFDHHMHTATPAAPPPNFRGAFGEAPSAAHLVYEYYGGEAAMPGYAELVRETDRLDSANLTPQDVMAPQGWIKLGFTIDGRTGLGFGDGRSGLGSFEGYFLQLLEMLVREATVEEVLAHPEVARRCQAMDDADAEFQETLRIFSHMEGNVVVTDFRPLERIPVGNRFLVYAMFPRANVSVRLHWGPNREHPMLVLGHSIFNRSCKTNVGELAARYGGGGHRGAGSVALMDDPEQQIRMILAELKANG